MKSKTPSAKPQSNLPHKEIRLSQRDNPLLNQVLEIVNAHTEVQTLWKVVNVHAVRRLNMTDHGPFD